jgi:tetratricopeptide (TPR) repeat protein
MTPVARHRYPGPPPFEDTPEDRLVFFGRDPEIAAVSQLVIASRLVVVFGKSGLGKTSLLNAGVFPRLRGESFLPAVIRIRPGVGPVSLVTAALQEAASHSATDHSLPAAPSLWELFKTAAIWRKQTLLTPVLVFDQFEEAFTFLEEQELQTLADELGALVSGSMPEGVRLRQRALPEAERLPDSPPHIKVVLSMREEYLAALEELSHSIPQVFQDRVRLQPLSDVQAKKAICEPASLERMVAIDDGYRMEFATERFEYDESALAVMLEFLHGRSRQIEPWELQLLCMHVEQHVVPRLRDARGSSNPLRVTAADLGGADAMRRVLSTFYETTIGKLPGAQGRRARELCDTGLVSSQGRRLPLERDQIRSEWKVTDETLDRLVDDRLVRRETRLESTFYEISHDTLAETILLNRRRRLPRRLRVAAWVFGVMVCCGLAFWAWTTRIVWSERNQAARARSQSEQLVAFLIGEDLLERLGRSGQMTMLEVVQQRVKVHLAQIPEKAASRGSRTAEAFANLNEGDLAFLNGRLTDAGAAFRSAVDKLRSLHGDDGSDAVMQGGLARALERAADVAEEQGKLPDALALRSEALRHRDDLVSRQPDDDSLQRRLANAHVGLANGLRKQGKPSEASRHAEQAVRLVNRVRSGSAPEWDYVGVDALDINGSLAEQKHDYIAADAAFMKLRDIARRLKEALPFEAKAHYTFGLATYRLANSNTAALKDNADGEKNGPENASSRSEKTAGGAKHETTSKKPSEIQADVYRELYQTIKAMTRWEPRNRVWLRELAASGMWVGWGEAQLDRKDAAVRQYRSCLAEFERLSASGPTPARRSDVAWAHEWLADVVSDQEVRQHLDAAVAIHADLVRIDPTDRTRLYDLVRLELKRGLHLQGSDALKALDHAVSLLEAVSDIDPADGDYFDLLHAIQTERSQQLVSADVSASMQAARRAVEAADKAIAGGMCNHFFLSARGRALRTLASRQRDAGDVGGASASSEQALISLKEAADVGRKTDDATSWNQVFLALYDDLRSRQKTGGSEGTAKASRELTDAVERAVAAEPDVAVYRSNLGAAYRLVGDGHRTAKTPELKSAEAAYAKSEEAIRKAASLEKSARCWNELYLLFYSSIVPLRNQQGLRSAALEAYRRAADAVGRAIELEPTNATYHSNLHLAHREIGDRLVDDAKPDLLGAIAAYKQALRAITEASRLELKSVSHLINLSQAHGRIARTLGREGNTSQAEMRTAHTRAVEAGRRATEVDPKAAKAWEQFAYAQFDRADAFDKTRETGEALTGFAAGIRALDRAIALNSKAAVYYSSLSQANYAMALLFGPGDVDEAADKYERAIAALIAARAIDPNAAWLRDALADRYYDAAIFYEQKKKDPGRAVAAFQAAVPHARDRAQRPSAVVDDQLAYVNVILGIERTGKALLTPTVRAEAISILRRLNDQAKLPSDWMPVLNRINRQ